MMATKISAGRASPRFGRRLALLLLGCWALTPGVGADPAAPGVGGQNPWARRAEQIFAAAQRRYEANRADPEAAWHFGRAGFDWAEFATNHAQRASIAREAIAVCRDLVAREPGLVGGHYYLAMNLGQLARTKTLGALGIVNEMERHFKKAREVDATFDYAGPDRCLGLLYLDAPGWPASIGSRSKAAHHLERAVALSPDFPENRLCLLEAYLRWGRERSIHQQWKQLEELLASARQTLTGEAWGWSWLDWDRRWEKLASRLGRLPAAP